MKLLDRAKSQVNDFGLGFWIGGLGFAVYLCLACCSVLSISVNSSHAHTHGCMLTLMGVCFYRCGYLQKARCHFYRAWAISNINPCTVIAQSPKE